MRNANPHEIDTNSKLSDLKTLSNSVNSTINPEKEIAETNKASVKFFEKFNFRMSARSRAKHKKTNIFQFIDL